MSLSMSLGVAACKGLGDEPLPSGVADPTMVANAEGARGLAASTHAAFQTALVTYIRESGLLTDELQANDRGVVANPGAIGDADLSVDSRHLPEQATAYAIAVSYPALHLVRTQAQEAIAALEKYVPDSSNGLRGALYAWQGYAEVLLADLYCSGVPLSHVNFQHDYTYAPSSTTAQVYEHAIVLFDSAMALASDSAPVVGLASVGKGRALLALGRYADAAQAVSAVPVDFQYADSILACNLGCPGTAGQATLGLSNDMSVGNLEGGNGRPYISSHDPRTAVLDDPVGTTQYGYAIWYPVKYPDNSVNPIVVASGTEAQLIQAEAALQAGQSDTWLQILNTLRASNPLTSDMPAIVDPGTFDTRVDTLFAERAAWLFLTGERQGDLRRLVNLYHRPSASVYPSGAYPGIGTYGTNIDMPIPASELANPYFTGCLRRD
jgi:hypothetical protein